MITNFEEITVDLNPRELAFIPILVEWFKDKKVPMKSHVVCTVLNAAYPQEMQFAMNDVRLRKLTNYIRVNSLLPLIATSNGYFTSYDEEVVKSQIKSLTERANSIASAANGLTKFLTLEILDL